MIKFDFDIYKIIQIVNYLLERNGGSMNYTKLLKLLYIADKEFLKKWDFTITQDKYCSMGSGPVLSETYDLISNKNKKENLQTQWNCLFTTIGYELTLLHKKNNLPIDRLSRAEKEILDAIYKKHKDHDFNRMIAITHDKILFPEVKWEEAQKENASIDLPIEDILRSLNRTPEEIATLDAEITSQQKEALSLLS